MRRWQVALIIISVLLFALAAWKIARDAAKQKREKGYAVALKTYSEGLRPGVTRKIVEEYLRSRHKQFFSVFTSFGGGSRNADLVKIGEEAAPWYCSEAYVYLAFEFATSEVAREDNSDVLQRIELFRPLTGCL